MTRADPETMRAIADAIDLPQTSETLSGHAATEFRVRLNMAGAIRDAATTIERASQVGSGDADTERQQGPRTPEETAAFIRDFKPSAPSHSIPAGGLRECPFCGGEAELIGPDTATRYFVRCKACNATSDWQIAAHGGQAKDAIAAWNRRPAAPAGGEERIEAMGEAWLRAATGQGDKPTPEAEHPLSGRLRDTADGLESRLPFGDGHRPGLIREAAKELNALLAQIGAQQGEMEHWKRQFRKIQEQSDIEIESFSRLTNRAEAAESRATALKARLESAEKGLAAVAELIHDSTGVAGLHLNGDLAPWAELRTGGRFEEWLLDFDAALPASPETEGGK